MRSKLTAIIPFLVATIACGNVGDEASTGDSRGALTATSVSDVWVFSAPPSQDLRLASLTGTPIIAEDCLMIETYIVVWREADLPQIPAIVDAARAGTNNKIRVGGDLLRDWDADPVDQKPPPLVPAAIAERCSIGTETAVWEASSAPESGF